MGAREDHGKWGREASKDSSEVGIPQLRDKEAPQYSAEVGNRKSRRIANETRRSRDIRGKTVRQNSVACVETPAQQCRREKERWDTGGLTANNDHTGGVEGLSGPHRGRVPQTRRQNCFQRKTVVNRRFTRRAGSRFTKRAGRVLTSTASRRRLERCMQHSADER